MSKKAAPTPGPWVIPVANVFRVIALKDGKPHRVIVGDTAQDNCHFGQDDIGWKPSDDAGEAAANARLISASPEMLTLLKRFVNHFGGMDMPLGITGDECVAEGFGLIERIQGGR